MKDVIGNLAASINNLKDVVSDLQAEQDIPSGVDSVPPARTPRTRKARAGLRRGGQSHNTGGSAGEDFAAGDEGGGNGGDGDDEGDGDGGDGNQVEQKDFKMRVSARPKSAGARADENSE